MPVALGESNQVGAIEIDAVVMDQVGVLVRVLAAGLEPDLPFVLVDTLDATNDVLARSDQVLDLALPGIDQVQVPPAIALGGIEDLLAIPQPAHRWQVHAVRVSRPDKCLGLLVDDIADLAGLCINLDQSETLMAAVRLLVGECVAVAVPAQ